MRARGRARSLSAPAKSKKDPPLTLEQLIRHDDLCADALVDRVSTQLFNHSMRPSVQVPKLIIYQSGVLLVSNPQNRQ
jgi:hypothetical protein